MNQSSKNVLVVDDEPEMLSVLQEFYELFGWNVFAANSGSHALELLSEHGSKIRLIVSDYSMPQMTGMAFLRKAREMGHAQPFVFFSAYVSEKELQKARDLGVAKVIDKGINFQNLIDASEIQIQELQNLKQAA